MTFSYQPSAAGISWLSMSSAMDQRMQMEQDLLKINSEGTKVQCNMTQTSSEQTLNELNAQADGIQKSAIGTMTGAFAGMAVSVGSFIGAYKTMPTEESQTTTNKVTIEKVDEGTSVVGKPSSQLSSNVEPVEGTASINGQNGTSGNVQETKSQTTPAKDTNNANGGKTTPSRAAWNNFWTSNGRELSNLVSTVGSSSGSMLQADETRKQAIAKSIAVATQGIADVMKQQQGMLSSAIGSCDTSFNNTEGTFTTIIQVSAVRG